MSNDLQLTGERGLRAIAQRMHEIEKEPTREFTPRTEAEAMSDHFHALYRFAIGRDQMPEPTREQALAIHGSYYLLLDENLRLRREVGADRMYERMIAFAQQCPALERWRSRVLELNRRSPLERAAAWELTALLEELEGNALDAEFARMYAADAMESVSSKQKQGEVAA